MKKKVKILFTTPVIAFPPVGGPFLRIENSIKALSRIAKVRLHARQTLPLEGKNFYEGFLDSVKINSTQRSLGRLIFFPFRVWNYAARRIPILRKMVVPIEFFEKFFVILDVWLWKPDVIWLGYGNISYPLLQFLKRWTSVPIVCDTDSVWSRFVMRELPYTTDERKAASIRAAGAAKEEEEKNGIAIADITTAVSEIDADYYRSISPAPNRVKIFSNVIDMDSYKTVPPADNRITAPSIYLAGSFGPGSPMDDAARWMLKEVWPVLVENVPSIQFYIVGTHSKETLADIDLPGVHILGRLDSVLPVLCHVGVALVPLRFESGTRFKILEAGACAKAVVSTTLGAEGLPVRHGHDILIADTPEEFASAIQTVITDSTLRQRLGENLKQTISVCGSIDKHSAEGAAIIEALSFPEK